jgi:predicted nucleic acid-binding protein
MMEGLLAATAVHHPLTLVIRDTRHLDGTGVGAFQSLEIRRER